jgi:hypothetical protein
LYLVTGVQTCALPISERLATELREWFAPFRAGFPDWRQEIDELVAEGDTVVARCRNQLGRVARRGGHRPVDGGGRGLVLHRRRGPSRSDVEPRGHVVAASTAGNSISSDRGRWRARTAVADRPFRQFRVHDGQHSLVVRVRQQIACAATPGPGESSGRLGLGSVLPSEEARARPCGVPLPTRLRSAPVLMDQSAAPISAENAKR